MIALDISNHCDFVCKKFILNTLNNTHYDIYCSIKSAKELQNALNKEFTTKIDGM